MPIIIDNFSVNNANPIDNRCVVGTTSFYTNKDLIQYKYPGLRIWDLNDGTPYVWTGTTWLSENSVGVTVDNTTVTNYIPKFKGTTLLGNSIIYETGTGAGNVGIGLAPSAILPNISGVTTQINGLHVSGNIKTDNKFIGNGLYITDINASNITSGSLTINRISPLFNNGGSTNTSQVYVLQNTGNNIEWVLSSSISGGSSTNSDNVKITEDNTTSATHYINFTQGYTQYNILKASSSKLQFKPSTGQLFLSNGSAGAPVYSFLNSTSGMYYDGYNINFSISGANKVSISPGAITIYDSNYAQIDFYKSPTDVQKLFVGQGSILKYRTNAWDPNGGVQVASDNIVWHSGNLYTLRNSGNLPIETIRDTNSQSTDANGNVIKGVYTYNYYGAPPVTTSVTPISNVFTNTIAGNIGTSQHVYFSVLSFGKGDEGSVQLASNWVGNNTPSNGNVVADREILIRSLRDTPNSVWSPWVKIWNSGNSGYVPFGAIMMWSGSATLLPTGWRLCDGSAAVTIPAGSVPGQPLMTSITIPDLRERFVVGSGVEPNKLINNYALNFQLVIPPSGFTQPYVFNVDVTTPYYVDSTGRLRSGVNTDGFRYHLYLGTNTFPANASYRYIVYDNRYGSYVVIKGAFPNVNSVLTGIVEWMGINKGGTAYILLTSNNPAFPLNNDTHVKYDKYFTNGRRVAFTEIIWPTMQSPGYATNDKGGADTIILEGSQIPKHQHDSMGENGTGPYGTYGLQNNSGAKDSDNYRWSTSAYGNSQPFDNRPPYYALAFIIYTGI